MAINISVIESDRQIIFEVPEYVTVTIDQPATIFYTTDDSVPDPSGISLTTFIVETQPNNHLSGVIFMPRDANFVALNILAIGVPNTNIGNFYRRYGLDPRHIGSTKRPIGGGTTILVTPSPNITATGEIIAPDGYTTGSAPITTFTKDGYDGYKYVYGVGVSGVETTIPAGVYDHIVGYGGDGQVIATTTLTPEQELTLEKLSDRGDIYVDDGQGLTLSPNLVNIDPRSSNVIDSRGRQIEVIPVEDYPIDGGYVVDGYSIDSNFDNAPAPSKTAFTSSGIFNPRAAYIEIDGRIDGYINGRPILPNDRVIINKPYGELRYLEKKEDLSTAIRVTNGYVSGGLVCNIYDYNKGQAAFYYFDHHDNRWMLSLQKITAPVYDLIAQRNGVVLGMVFKWITNKRQVMPG